MGNDHALSEKTFPEIEKAIVGHLGPLSARDRIQVLSRLLGKEHEALSCAKDSEFVMPARDRRLTPAQARHMRAIQVLVDAQGFPPTYREIAKTIGIRSTNAVSDMLFVLERKGYLVRGHNGRSREIRILQRIP